MEVTGADVSFRLQHGLVRDTVIMNASQMTLKTLKDKACEFINVKGMDIKYEVQLIWDAFPSELRPRPFIFFRSMVCHLFWLVYFFHYVSISFPLYLTQMFPDNKLNKLNERLILYRHDYDSPNILQIINAASEVTQDSLVEIVMSAHNPADDNVLVQPHMLYVHSYKTPTFCDVCGEMLWGLVKQGLRCEGCGLNFHKRCSYKIPNDCSNVRRRASVQPVPRSPSESHSSLHAQSSQEVDGTMVTTTSSPNLKAGRERPSFSGSCGRPVWVEKELATRIKVPHSFALHTYTKPTVCSYCKKLLKGFSCEDELDEAGDAVGYREDDSDNENENDSPPDSLRDAFGQDEEGHHPVSPSGSNIPLMRVVQSIKHTKRPTQVLKEDVSRGVIHCFEIHTANAEYYVGEDQVNKKEGIPVVHSPESGLGLSIAKEWENEIRHALRPVASPQPDNSSSSNNINNAVQGMTKEEAICTDISQLYQIFVDEILGSGQFGIVYGGVHRKSSRGVAIKVIDKRRFPTKQEAALKNEVAILQSIRHQGVVNLERMFETSDKIFIVMEKLKGDMLELIINSEKGMLTERYAKFLVYQVIIALKYLHNHNIVHCDLKPENVLLSASCTFCQVKLCDFGFARIIGERSFRRSIVGTPAYLAPEVLRNKGYNRSLDMWSVGVIVYVSLSGTFPFNEDEDINDQIQNAAFMYPSNPWKMVSPEAIDLINCLLQVKQRKRLTVDKALSHVWLQDFQLWLDLRELEKKVGERWLTHECDDARWEAYSHDNNLKIPEGVCQTLTEEES